MHLPGCCLRVAAVPNGPLSWDNGGCDEGTMCNTIDWHDTMRPWPRLLRAPRLHEFTAKTQALTHASGSSPQRGRPGAR